MEQLNAFTENALANREVAMQVRVWVYDESGNPILVSPDHIANLDVQDSFDRSTMRLSLSVFVDSTTRDRFKRYRSIRVEELVFHTNPAPPQVIRAFTGKIWFPRKGLVEKNGVAVETIQMECLGTTQDLAEADVALKTTPTVYNPPVNMANGQFANFNLTAILRAVSLPMFSTGPNSVDIVPVNATYDNPTNLKVYTLTNGGTFLASSADGANTADKAFTGMTDYWKSADTLGSNAWVQVTFPSAQLVDRVTLVGLQASEGGAMNNGTVTFSDGSSVAFSGLGTTALEVPIEPARSTSSIKVQGGNQAQATPGLKSVLATYQGQVVNSLKTNRTTGFDPHYPTTGTSVQDAATGQPWVYLDEVLGLRPGDDIIIRTPSGTTYLGYKVFSVAYVAKAISLTTDGSVAANVPATLPTGTTVHQAYTYSEETFTKIAWGATAPIDRYYVDVKVVEGWVIRRDDLVANTNAWPSGAQAITLAANQELADLPSLPTNDANYIDYYHYWDQMTPTSVELQLGGYQDAVDLTRFEVLPQFGMLRWAAKPWHFRASKNRLRVYTRVLETNGQNNQVENVLNSILVQAGLPAMSSRVDAAPSFNGTSQYGTIPYKAAQSTDQFTIEAFIQLDDLTARERVIFDCLDSVALTGFQVYITDYQVLGARVYAGGVLKNQTGGRVSDDKLPRHIAITYDGSRVYGMVDGVITLNTIGTFANYSRNQTKPITVGGITGKYFPGKIWDVRLWNSAKSEQYIASNRFTEYVGNETGLLGLWKMNEGSGATFKDSSSYRSDGTLTTGVPWVLVCRDSNWAPLGIAVGPGKWVSKAADAVNQVRKTALPPNVVLKDWEDGSVSLKVLKQKTTPDWVLDVDKTLTEVDVPEVFTQTIVYNETEPANLAPHLLYWVAPGWTDFYKCFDYREDSYATPPDGSLGFSLKVDNKYYGVMGALNQVLKSVKVKFAGAMYIVITTDPSRPKDPIQARGVEPAPLVFPDIHPSTLVVHPTENWLEVTDWAAYEPVAQTYYLHFYFGGYGGDVTVGGTNVTPKVYEVEVRLSEYFAAKAVLSDNPNLFTPLNGVPFADQGSDQYGSYNNWRTADGGKTWYRYAPTEKLKRHCLKYIAGQDGYIDQTRSIHRTSRLPIKGASPKLAGLYARQYQNEYIIRAGQEEIQVVYAPHLRTGDTVLVRDRVRGKSYLRMIAGYSKQYAAQRPTMTLQLANYQNYGAGGS